MAKDFFTTDEKQRIREAIRAAENKTSGEIQVHLENRSLKPVPERAAEIFNILKVYNTARRNGVLFYLAVSDRQFAVLGDTGIDQVTGHEFWDNIKQHLEAMFREGKFADGLCQGIRMAGEQLRNYFPIEKDDRNELSDDISFDKN